MCDLMTNKRGRKYLGSILPYFNDSGESIFDYTYPLEFEFITEKFTVNV